MLGPAIMQFDGGVEWNGVAKAAGTQFTTDDIGVLAIIGDNTSGTIIEKIEKTVTINEL
jgi:hypothetical protein